MVLDVVLLLAGNLGFLLWEQMLQRRQTSVMRRIFQSNPFCGAQNSIGLILSGFSARIEKVVLEVLAQIIILWHPAV